LVLERPENEWWRAQSKQTRQIGMVPANYLKPAIDLNPVPEPEPVVSPMAELARRPLPREPEPLATIDVTPVLPPTPVVQTRAPQAPVFSYGEPVVPAFFREIPKEKLPERPKFIVCRAKLDRNPKDYDKGALKFKVRSAIAPHAAQGRA
jgi:hypothetical protein